MLVLKTFHEVPGQSAVGTVENDSRLPLDQQTKFREFVFQYGAAGDQPVHEPSPL
jgi:hypothetical protein